jgi:hypothetical protein
MIHRNNTGRLGFRLHQCVLRNTLAGSKTVVSMSRNPTVATHLGLRSGFDPPDLERPGRLPHQLEQGLCEARLGYRDGSPQLGARDPIQVNDSNGLASSTIACTTRRKLLQEQRGEGGLSVTGFPRYPGMYVYYCRTYAQAVRGGGEREKGGQVLRDH